jgi:hypothetical protein
VFQARQWGEVCPWVKLCSKPTEVVQTPAAQTCPAAQARLHAPQCVVEVLVSTSQPSLTAPLQSRNPPEQLPTRHAPATQAAVPLVTAPQAWPQAPQFAMLVVTLTSQPSPLLLLQSRKSALQVKEHAAARQAALALATSRQVVPQAPQFVASVAVFTQAEPQAVRPVVQVSTHAPLLHTRPAAQALLHAPQWAGLLRMSRHTPPQFVSPLGQRSSQRPPLQTSPSPHETPQPPQFSRSVWRSRQTPPQSERPVAQVATQRPARHARPAAQALPQVPQFALSLCRSRQVLLHTLEPDGHDTAHTPAWQSWPLGQALSHMPQ